MKKSDIKPGMVVETKEGKYLIIDAGNELLLLGDGFTTLSNYDDDLRNFVARAFDKNNDKYDIIKIYEGLNDRHYVLGCGLDDYLSKYATESKLIWERPKVVEVTLQQIADKLGIPVEQLLIKE